MKFISDYKGRLLYSSNCIEELEFSLFSDEFVSDHKGQLLASSNCIEEHEFPLLSDEIRLCPQGSTTPFVRLYRGTWILSIRGWNSSLTTRVKLLPSSNCIEELEFPLLSDEIRLWPQGSTTPFVRLYRGTWILSIRGWNSSQTTRVNYSIRPNVEEPEFSLVSDQIRLWPQGTTTHFRQLYRETWIPSSL
jgi:hypothetical protein